MNKGLVYFQFYTRLQRHIEIWINKPIGFLCEFFLIPWVFLKSFFIKQLKEDFL